MTRKSGRIIKKPANFEDYEMDEKEPFENVQKKRTRVAKREFSGTIKKCMASSKPRKRTLRIDNAFRKVFYKKDKDFSFWVLALKEATTKKKAGSNKLGFLNKKLNALLKIFLKEDDLTPEGLERLQGAKTDVLRNIKTHIKDVFKRKRGIKNTELLDLFSIYLEARKNVVSARAARDKEAKRRLSPKNKTDVQDALMWSHRQFSKTVRNEADKLCVDYILIGRARGRKKSKNVTNRSRWRWLDFVSASSSSLKKLAETPCIVRAASRAMPFYDRNSEHVSDFKGDEIKLKQILEFEHDVKVEKRLTNFLRSQLNIATLKIGAMKNVRKKWGVHLIGLPISWNDEKPASKQTKTTLREAVIKAEKGEITAVDVSSYNHVETTNNWISLCEEAANLPTTGASGDELKRMQRDRALSMIQIKYLKDMKEALLAALS